MNVIKSVHTGESVMHSPMHLAVVSFAVLFECAAFLIHASDFNHILPAILP